MATLALVQTTSATATSTATSSRHQSQPYPLVRPSSSSSSARPASSLQHHHHQQQHQHPHQQPQQHPQMYHLMSSPPPQMFQQSAQTQQFLAMNYDYTRQTYQAQQAAKQQQQQPHYNHYGQRRPNSTHPLRPQFQSRSRSEEALRDKSLGHANIMSPPNPLEAQSAPLPAELRHSIAGLAPPPPVMSAQSRPSSADGSSNRPGTASTTTATATATATGYIPRPTHVAGYGHQPRYSAEDVSTMKMSNAASVGNGGYVTPPFPVHPRYQNLQLYGHGGRGGGYLPQPPPSPHARPLPSPTRTQQPSPTRSQTPQLQQPSVRQQQPSPQPSRSPQPSPTTKPPPPPPPARVSPQPAPTNPQVICPVIPPTVPPHHNLPQQTPPAIQRRNSSLHRNERPRPQIPDNLKRASSSPELSPPHLLHRKTSSTSSTTSAASAPSQLETASTHSSIPSTHSSIPSQSDQEKQQQQQQQHSPLIPSPLGKPTDDPPVVVIPSVPTPTAVEKRQSLSSRLKRALSFSGPSTNLTTSVSTPDLHSPSTSTTLVDDVPDTSDKISISSTASSASIMLRKVGASFRKSRKSLVGIFKSRRRMRDEEEDGEADAEEGERENKFPFGVPGEDGVGVVTYATAEGEMSRESGESRKSMVFQEREQPSVEQNKKRNHHHYHKGKGKKSEPVVIRGILKNSDSRQSSFESVGDESMDSITEIPAADPVTTTNTPSTPSSPVTEFAKSLASTLDTQFDPSMSPPPGSDASDPAYFDIPPSTPHRRAVTAPATPTGRSTPRRGIQFSPKLEVHETWHSAEYDRRGEPATCNRLTAQLAQMIKEELNAFKKEEMIVHEESRSYTHFF